MKTYALIPFASLAVVAAPATAAPVIGDSVSCTGLGVSCSVPLATVGAGTEFVALSGSDARFTADFSSNLLTITWLTSGLTTGDTGARFTDLTSPFTTITSFSKVGTSTVTQSAFSISNGVLAFNHVGQTSNFGSVFTLALGGATSAVPEASTWAMMLLGLGAVGASLRRRQKVTTRVTFA